MGLICHFLLSLLSPLFWARDTLFLRGWDLFVFVLLVPTRRICLGESHTYF